MALRWRHNGHDGVSNYQPHHCLVNRLFGCRSKKKSKLRVTGLCAGNSPGTGEFPAQKASNAENVSIWWRHHDMWIWNNESKHVSIGRGLSKCHDRKRVLVSFVHWQSHFLKQTNKQQQQQNCHGNHRRMYFCSVVSMSSSSMDSKGLIVYIVYILPALMPLALKPPVSNYNKIQQSRHLDNHLNYLLLTWFNLNPSMD